MIPLWPLVYETSEKSLWSAWELSPPLVILLLLALIAYVVGLRRLRRRAPGRGLRNWEIGCFFAGWGALVLALVSPLHEMGETLLSVHMVQHIVLMNVAAPCLVLGRPLVPFVWALPQRWRMTVGRWTTHGPFAPVWRITTRPLTAWVLQGVMLCGWHAPKLYIAALHSELIHTLEHLCFLVAALFFWWSVLHVRGRHYGISVLSLFTTAMYAGGLGALMTVSPSVWYPPYSVTAPQWGLTALQDQQLAGLIMWIPGGVSYLIAVLALALQWLRVSDLQLQENTRHGTSMISKEANHPFSRSIRIN